jgi:hypothetical protein
MFIPDEPRRRTVTCRSRDPRRHTLNPKLPRLHVARMRLGMPARLYNFSCPQCFMSRSCSRTPLKVLILKVFFFVLYTSRLSKYNAKLHTKRTYLQTSAQATALIWRPSIVIRTTKPIPRRNVCNTSDSKPLKKRISQEKRYCPQRLPNAKPSRTPRRYPHSYYFSM